MNKDDQTGIERSQIYQDKLVGNSQRNARQKYLSTLEPDLSHYLSSCQYLGPDEFRQIDPLFYNPLFYIQPADSSRRVHQFSWLEQALAMAQTIGAQYDDTMAYLRLYGGNPIYSVCFGWARENLEILYESSIGIVTSDQSAGIVIREYLGTLEMDPNPDEVIYQLAMWG